MIQADDPFAVEDDEFFAWRLVRSTLRTKHANRR